MKSSAQKLQSWIQIRKDLYKQVRQHVEKRLGKQPSIESYQQDYGKTFQKQWRVSSPEKLFTALGESQVILLADFHALSQSQKSHLRLLNSLGADRVQVLALECFYEEDQRWIDKYLAGQMGEQEFLKSIRWTSKWGFPWSHYRGLVEWAKQGGVRILALNKSFEREGLRALHDRDRLAAEVLANLINTKPVSSVKSKIVVIYGDLHLARNHLPLQLEKRIGRAIKTVRVFQNSEKIYFQLAKRALESEVDVIDLGQNTFCLNSVPPWVKWQNYLLFLESGEDLEIGAGEVEIEPNDQVGQYVKLMGDELGLPFDLTKLSVFTAQESSLWNQLEAHLDAKTVKGFKLFIENEISFVSPASHVAFLSRLSVNHAATLAMHFLHSETAKVKTWGFRGPEDFERLIWVFGFGYFGSKLINPKRKSDTLVDIKSAISSRITSEYGKEALRLALAQKMNELLFMAHRRRPRLSVQPRKKISYVTAAELLGGLLGERLYNGYREGILSLMTLKNLMQKDWSRDDFRLTYLEAMEMIEGLPLAFQSKKDKL